jgi:hypothetical protein
MLLLYCQSPPRPYFESLRSPASERASTRDVYEAEDEMSTTQLDNNGDMRVDMDD